MSTIEAIVLRRVVLNRASLTGGALALHNYQMGMARADSEIVFRDDIGSFHYFKSDAKNELKYSQLGHIHDDRYYTETEIDDIISSLAISHKTLSDLQGGQAGQYYHLTQLEWETKILGLGITGRIPLYSAERKITSSILSGDASGIYPISNGTKALGSTSLRFSELWANTVYENGTSLALKYSPIGHTHDDRYYTESEINSHLIGKENSWGRGTVTDAGNLNDLRTPATYFVSNAAYASGMPSGAYGYGVLHVFAQSTNVVTQIYTPHRDGALSTAGMWIRVNHGGIWKSWQHIFNGEYNDAKYASLDGAAFTGSVTSTGYIYASDVVSSGYDMSCARDMSVGRNFSVDGFSDLRGAVKLTGLTISTSNADAVISASASGFINTATYTANRTVELPVPEKGKILTLSNRGSSTVYGMVLRPASGTTIHYGITPTLTGGNVPGIKSMILEGVSSTNWAVMSMWSL